MKAQVLLPKIFNFPFTYNSNRFSLHTGDIVEVPFGQKKEIGVVWPGEILKLKNVKIKKINKKINNFSLNNKFISFINWFATYNMMPLGLVLKMSIGNNLNYFSKNDKDLVSAIPALIITTLIAICVIYMLEKRIPILPLMGAVLVCFFGGLTIFFNNPIFIYMF